MKRKNLDSHRRLGDGLHTPARYHGLQRDAAAGSL